MEAVIRGWVNYFSIAKAKSKMKELDEHARPRLRIGISNNGRSRGQRKGTLLKLGVRNQKAYEWGASPIVALTCLFQIGMPKACFNQLNNVVPLFIHIGYSKI